MAPIEIVPYDPYWPSRFEAIKATLLPYLQGIDRISIEHVGSTSVPGLPAKPTIDINIIVSTKSLDLTISAVVRAGYEYLGERGIPDRHAFRHLQTGEKRNLYVCIEGSESLRNHLALRNVLRIDDQLRKEYGDVKLKLAARQLRIDEYCLGKNEIVSKILQKAGFDEDSRRRIEAANQSMFGKEWKDRQEALAAKIQE